MKNTDDMRDFCNDFVLFVEHINEVEGHHCGAYVFNGMTCKVKENNLMCRSLCKRKYNKKGKWGV